MGAQLRVYRQKIKSAQTTKKITRAMELIAASRIQKAQARVTASTPYSRAITRAVSAVATYSNVDHVLTTEPETIERAAVVILTSDRGLAGAFNSQVLREAEQLAELLRSQGKDVVYFLVGRKAVGYFQFRRRASERQWTGSTENPEFELAKEIADAVLEVFLRDAADGGVDEIHVVYNRFVSMMTQTPEVVRLLPLEVVEGVEEPDATVQPLYEFEPDVETVLDALLPVYIESRIFNALLQSAAAKHAATQKAMKSASDNADKLITDYTRLANNARQAEITQQISEIVGGADALVAEVSNPRRRERRMTDTATAPVAEATGGAVGRIARVTGPVVDIEFPHDSIPEIYNALKTDITIEGVTTTITLEVAQHLGDDLVRAIALKPTDGLVRGQEVIDTGEAISVPVGDVTKGKVFNVIGEVLNGEPGEQHRDHRALADPPQAPGLRPARVEDAALRDRHQGHRPPHPVRAGWQDRPLRRCRRRQDRPHPGDDPARRAGPRWCVGVRRCRRAHP